MIAGHASGLLSPAPRTNPGALLLAELQSPMSFPWDKKELVLGSKAGVAGPFEGPASWSLSALLADSPPPRVPAALEDVGERLAGLAVGPPRPALQALRLGSCCCLDAETPLQPRGPEPARLLSPWDLPGKSTGAGCRFLLWGIFLTRGSNPCLLRWQA